MFGLLQNGEALAREVRLEVNYLTKLYGDDAGRIALEKAQRPRLRTIRRRVLKEAARQLARVQKPDLPAAVGEEPATSHTTVHAIDDEPRSFPSAGEAWWRDAAPQPVFVEAEGGLPDVGQLDAPRPVDPTPMTTEPPASAKRVRRRVLSRATARGIELEVDGVLVRFDGRADAKVVFALIHALRDS